MHDDVLKDVINVIERLRKSDTYIEHIRKEEAKNIRIYMKYVLDEIKKNQQFKDKHKGERCFILGNGPSLNEVDFHLLRDEVVFTVNQLICHDKFCELQSNYHVITDLDFFGIGEKNKTCKGFSKMNMDMFAELSKYPNITVFLPITTKRILNHRSELKKINTRYLYLDYKHFFFEGYEWNDLTKPVSTFCNVICYTILIATYMGFSEIYLLGCDQTVILDVMNVALKKNELYGHAYHREGDDPYEDYGCYLKSDGIMSYLNLELNQHRGFASIYSFCKRNGITLCNLTSNSLIDVIPKRNLYDVLKVRKV